LSIQLAFLSVQSLQVLTRASEARPIDYAVTTATSGDEARARFQLVALNMSY
jgi:hypothetical protein